MKYRTVTPIERDTIRRLYEQGGWTYRQLHEEFNVPMGSLHHLVHSAPITSGGNSPYRSRGRKPIFTPEIKQHLIETATANAYNRRLPLSEVAKLAGVQASDRSLRRIFRSQGYNRRIARVKPFLTAAAKQRRLQWAQQFQDWREGDWGEVIFSDTAAFNCGQLSGTIWVTRKPHEEYEEDGLVPKFIKLTTEMVWGAICGSEKSELIIWEAENWERFPPKPILNVLSHQSYFHGGAIFARKQHIRAIFISNKMELLHTKPTEQKTNWSRLGLGLISSPGLQVHQTCHQSKKYGSELNEISLAETPVQLQFPIYSRPFWKNSMRLPQKLFLGIPPLFPITSMTLFRPRVVIRSGNFQTTFVPVLKFQIQPSPYP